MLSYGLLVRAVESAINKGENLEDEAKTKLESTFNLVESRLKDLSEYLETEMDYEVVPIKKLIAIQLECGLLVSQHLNQKGA